MKNTSWWEHHGRIYGPRTLFALIIISLLTLGMIFSTGWQSEEARAITTIITTVILTLGAREEFYGRWRSTSI